MAIVTDIVIPDLGEFSDVDVIEILVKPGDKVIIASYAQVSDDEAHHLEPRVCFVDAQNRLR